MTGHRAIVVAGPGSIRRLCCATSPLARDDPPEIDRAALDAIDDPVALVGERPVAVDAVWEAALRAATCAPCADMVVVHPSGWPPPRVAVVAAAAQAVAGAARTRPRSWLLLHASPAPRDATAVVEIGERLVVITAGGVTGIARRGEPRAVAEAVADVVAGVGPAAVLIDTPSAVPGASALAALILDAGRDAWNGPDIVEVNDIRLTGLARSALPARPAPPRPSAGAPAGAARSRRRTLGGIGAAALVVATAAPAAWTHSAMPTGRPGAEAPRRVETAPTTFLVEGRVAVSVPADWPAQRVITGPGSARVQVTSPTDPEVALHVTQSPVPGETLGATAERLKRAMDAEPAGVFVDFSPSAVSGGRPAVTYREVRPGHHVRWVVLLDGPVRISIGCQSRPGDEAAVRDACERAVRTAHAIG